MRAILSKSMLVIFSYFLLLGSTAYSQSISASTEDGKQVILHPNGTWEYQKVRILPHSRPSSAKKLIKGTNGTYGIWIDQHKWNKRKTKEEGQDLAFEHVDGDIYARTVAERIPIPIGEMERIVIDNAKEGGNYKNTNVMHREFVVLNNIKLLHLKLSFEWRKISFVGSYYIYSGEKGTIQIWVATTTTLYSQYKKDITDFLNGFVILK